MSADLTALLLAALEAEQQIAEAASPGEWSEAVGRVRVDDRTLGVIRQQDDALHIAYQHPARTLRRIAALRRILERHEGKTWCNGCGHHTYPCPDLLDLADALGVEP